MIDDVETPALLHADAARSGTDAIASLDLAGRVMVVVLVVGAAVLAASSGFLALLFAVPFASVGALLAVRRPRTSIGWILLAIAWCSALFPSPVEATPEQFETGSLAWPTGLFVTLQWSSGAALFLLLALLAMAFPSGRLPAGRWGRVGRVALAAGLVLAAVAYVMPVINVNLVGYPASVPVRNPVALLPNLAIWRVITPDTAILPVMVLVLAGAVSLVVRVRRARGAERQQLRWFAASIAFVVLAVVGGLATGYLVPGAADSGLAWIPAMVAFPTVPIAIGIAVLRYRLYEIDTIINRAIVYGLLTAILAGSSAAVIGVGQRLFEGIMGPGSDATIVLTTLLVVTAFTPVKSRLQTIVDRHYKEVRDPAAVLEAFVGEVRRSLSRPDRDRTLRRLLEVAVASYGAEGGEVRTGPAAALGSPIVTGTMSAEPSVAVSATAGGLEVRLALSGLDPSRDPEPLREALRAIAAEVSGPA